MIRIDVKNNNYYCEECKGRLFYLIKNVEIKDNMVMICARCSKDEGILLRIREFYNIHNIKDKIGMIHCNYCGGNIFYLFDNKGVPKYICADCVSHNNYIALKSISKNKIKNESIDDEQIDFKLMMVDKKDK